MTKIPNLYSHVGIVMGIIEDGYEEDNYILAWRVRRKLYRKLSDGLETELVKKLYQEKRVHA